MIDLKKYYQIYRGLDSERDFSGLKESIAWQTFSGKMFGRTVIFPRQSAFYSDRSRIYQYSGTRHESILFSKVLLAIKKRIEEVFAETWNACLCNLYADGSEYMGWHADNEKVIDQSIGIVLCSYGATRRFGFRPFADKNNARAEFIELSHGDILMMSAGCQSLIKHALPKQASSQEERISLTWRYFH